VLSGYVKVHRKMMMWEWYKDNNTKSLFLHILLKTNHEDETWMGKPIKQGQFVTSLNHLSEETGIGVQSIRTSMNRLKSTHEITCESTNKYTLITLLNWHIYQGRHNTTNTQINTPPNNQLTRNQHATNKQLTTNKNDKNEENDKKGKKDKKEAASRKTVLFDKFYQLYPKKESKMQAQKAWMKLEPTQEMFDKIMDKLQLLIKSEQWIKDGGQFIPLPSTWINNRRWEDETNNNRKPVSKKPANAGNFSQREYSDEYMDGLYETFETPKKDDTQQT
jgi:hypothetical protein